jgi:hypothetical protein
MKHLLVLVILGLLSFSAHAEDAGEIVDIVYAKPNRLPLEYTPVVPEHSGWVANEIFRESNLAIRYRTDRNFFGSNFINHIVSRPRLHLTLPATDNLRIRVQAQTGSTYTSGWDRVYAWDNGGEDFPENFRVRRFFVEKNFDSDLFIMFGALTPGSPWVNTRPLALDPDGWADGLRFIYLPKHIYLDEVQATVGYLNPLSNFDFFRRKLGYKSERYQQIKFSKENMGRVSYLVDFSNLNNSQESFTRVDLDFFIKDFTKDIFDLLRIEQLTDNKSGRTTGNAFGVASQIKFLTIEGGVYKQERSSFQRLINNGIYRERGDQAYLNFEYRLSTTGWVLFQRFRSCIHKPSCENDYRFDTTLNYGL